MRKAINLLRAESSKVRKLTLRAARRAKESNRTAWQSTEESTDKRRGKR